MIQPTSVSSPAILGMRGPNADLYLGVAIKNLRGTLHRGRKSVLSSSFEEFTRTQARPYFSWAGTGSFGLVGRVAGGCSERDMEL